MELSFVEAQELESRGSKAFNCTFLGGMGGEIEVAKVVRSSIEEIWIIALSEVEDGRIKMKWAISKQSAEEKKNQIDQRYLTLST